jgi:hypothetical protein
MMHGIFITGHATVYICQSCDVAAFSFIRNTVVISDCILYCLINFKHYLDKQKIKVIPSDVDIVM